MDDYDDTNNEDDDISEDEDCRDNTEDEDDSKDSNVITDSGQDNGDYDRTQDEETIFNDTVGEYDWKSISDSDNQSIASLLVN